MTDCVYVVREQRVGVVAAAVAADYSEPFRLAHEGEPSIPVLFDDAECQEHGERSLTWRRVDPDHIADVERALARGCDGLCRCNCKHDPARMTTPSLPYAA